VPVAVRDRARFEFRPLAAQLQELVAGEISSQDVRRIPAHAVVLAAQRQRVRIAGLRREPVRADVRGLGGRGLPHLVLAAEGAGLAPQPGETVYVAER
jgi:hypothetical protein